MTAQTTEKIEFSLGSTYEITVPFAKNNANRVVQYALQDVIAKIIDNKRLHSCRRFIIPGKEKVDVLYSEKLARAHYGNLMVCGSIWVCPICAARIMTRKREEIAKGIDTFLELGGSVFMAAFTLQHDREERLKDVKGSLLKATGEFTGGRQYQKIKKEFGIIGNISALEVTWSDRAGWHPHKHYLFFSDQKLTQNDIGELQQLFSKRYCSILKRVGRYGSRDAAVKLSLGDPQQTKDYICKWGLVDEIALGFEKSARGNGFSPFQLAHWAGLYGEERPALLFREFFYAFKGSHQLQYSRGLREFLELGQERSDLELAKENSAEAVRIAQVEREAWRVICTKGLRGELLQAASSGITDNVVKFLEKNCQ